MSTVSEFGIYASPVRKAPLRAAIVAFILAGIIGVLELRGWNAWSGVVLRIPDQMGHPFRAKWAGHSGRNGPPPDEVAGEEGEGGQTEDGILPGTTSLTTFQETPCRDNEPPLS